MHDFPSFMKDQAIRIPRAQEHTPSVEGYVFDGRGNGQIAFWTCHDAQSSARHSHPFDEYLLVVAGEYTLIIGGEESLLLPGAEVVIEAGTIQSARIAPGTRTIHAFGGKRVTVEGPTR